MSHVRQPTEFYSTITPDDTPIDVRPSAGQKASRGGIRAQSAANQSQYDAENPFIETVDTNAAARHVQWADDNAHYKKMVAGDPTPPRKTGDGPATRSVKELARAIRPPDNRMIIIGLLIIIAILVVVVTMYILKTRSTPSEENGEPRDQSQQIQAGGPPEGYKEAVRRQYMQERAQRMPTGERIDNKLYMRQPPAKSADPRQSSMERYKMRLERGEEKRQLATVI